MASNPLKAFVPYLVPRDLVGTFEELEAHEITDPSGSQWRSIGFTPALPGESVEGVNLDGGNFLIAVQFADRILPGKVRDEVLIKRKTKLEEQTGRKMGKKEYAELRDEVEHELLPKAFIRRTNVPIIVRKYSPAHDLMLIFTSSQKKADEITTLMMNSIMQFACWKFQTELPVTQALTTLAREDFEVEKTERLFSAARSALLKGDEKKTIRIKDKDIGESDVQALLKQGYTVYELQMTLSDPNAGDDADITLTVNHDFVFKGVEVANVGSGKLKDDIAGFYWLTMTGIRDMLDNIIEMCPLAKLPDFDNTDLEDDEL